MGSYHEPTFLESGTRQPPQVPVFGSHKQEIGLRKLPFGRPGPSKITFSVDFTAADGRKPVTFDIAEATLDRVFGLAGHSANHVFERYRGTIEKVAATIYFRGRRTTITADDFRSR
jgi:hypothetical protein